MYATASLWSGAPAHYRRKHPRHLSAGETAEEILRQHPMLEPEDISACLTFASRLMAHKYSVKETA